MSKLNNPAGRLHELLTDFDELASTSITINDVWTVVLRTDPGELLPALGQAASLLGDVRTAVERSGRQSLLTAYEKFSVAWAIPFLSHGRNPSSDASHGLVDSNALVALGMVAEVLEMVAPDGSVPSPEAADVVRTDLRELLDALTADEELPADLRAMVAARVHDILWAIDHVRIVGPEGVQAAVERLIGQLDIFSSAQPCSRDNSVFKKVMQVAGRAWVAFRAVGAAHEAIDGWQKAFELLPPN